MSTTLEAKTAQELERDSSSLEERCRAIGPVVDASHYALKGELVVSAKALLKTIIAHHQPMKDAANRAHKEVCAAENRLANPLKMLIAREDADLTRWRTEQEQIRQQAQREAEERERQRAQDAIVAEAVAAERAGEHELAEAIVNLQPTPNTVTVPKAVPKVAGLRERQKYYSARVTNLMALAKAVVAGTVPLQAIQGNQTFLNDQAESYKDTLNYPGVEVVSR